MPRTCSVCVHPQRAWIDKALVGDTPLRNIAEHTGTSVAALHRHKAEHLPAALRKAQERQEGAHAAELGRQVQEQEAEEAARARDVLAELERAFVRVNKLFDACEAWLTDPADPERYSLDPRAEEVSVIYVEKVGRTVLRRKAALSALLERVASSGTVVERIESRHADPRDLLLKTAAQLKSQLELLAKLLGQLDDRPQVNLMVSPEWVAVRAALLEALGAYPEARVAVAERLMLLEGAP